MDVDFELAIALATQRSLVALLKAILVEWWVCHFDCSVIKSGGGEESGGDHVWMDAWPSRDLSRLVLPASLATTPIQQGGPGPRHRARTGIQGMLPAELDE